MGSNRIFACRRYETPLPAIRGCSLQRTDCRKTFCESVSFNPFSIGQYVVLAPKVDIGRCQVIQAFMVTPVVVVIDEPFNLLFKIAR